MRALLRRRHDDVVDGRARLAWLGWTLVGLLFAFYLAVIIVFLMSPLPPD